MNKQKYVIEEMVANPLDVIPDAAALVDKKGRIKLVNHALEKTIGFSKAEIVGKIFFELGIFVESKDILLKNLTKKIQDLPIDHYEISFTDKMGKSGFLEVTERRVTYAKKSVDLVILRDVTESKQVEQKIKQSEEKFRRFFEESGEAIFVADAETGIIVDCNLAASALVGREKQELVGQQQSVIHPGLAKEGFAGDFKKSILHSTQRIETQIITKSGEIKTVSIKARVLELQGRKLVQGFFRDITERKIAEKLLEKTRQELNLILDSSPILVFFKDSKGRFKQVNEAYAQALKMPKEKLLDKTVYDFYSSEIAESLTADDSEVLESKLPKFGIIGQYPSSTGLKWVKTDKIPIFDENGFVNGIVGFSEDITERKKAEQKLLESESRYRMVAENIHDVVTVADERGVFTYVSSSIEKIAGYTPEELVGQRCVFLFHPDDLATIINPRIQALLKGDEVPPTEFRVKTKNGQYIWVEGNPHLIRDSQGKLKLLVTSRNVEERKKAELDLKKSEEKYRNIFNNSGVGMFRTKSDGSEILDCNDKFLEIFGRTREELVGNPSVICWADPLERQEMVHLLHKRGHADDFECKMLNKKGEIKTCLTSVIFYPEQALFEGTLIDITERKKAEEMLNSSEKRARAVIENSPIGIATSGSEKRFLSANLEFCKILGFTEAELKKLTFKDITLPEDLNESVTKMAMLEAGKITAFHQEKRYVRKDGKIITGEISVNAIRDKDGKPTMFVAELQDITEKKKMQNELSEYSTKLEKLVEKRTVQLMEAQQKLVKAERLAAIGELAGMVGHDLRNPLAGIKNAVYFLEKKNDLISKTQKQEMFEAINRCIYHSDKIINDLLDYSRDIYPELAETSLVYLLNEALGMVKIPANVRVTRSVSDNLKLNVDANKISRVFINLIQNAIDAMPEGGKISIFAKEKDDHVSISISDTGTGIPDEILCKLFAPLVTSKAQGMGFGLAICKRIVDAHCGNLSVKTAKGEGTTFTVTLPIAPKIDFGCGKFWVRMPESLSLKTAKSLKIQ